MADAVARTHFPLTTPSQRRLLFETRQAIGDVAQACRVAHVGRRTFSYYWKPASSLGLWLASAPAQRGPSGQNRTADEPGQTVTADLCVVLATHAAAQRLPAVSGSSGRLVISGPRKRPEEPERTWPGLVFEDLGSPYRDAMHEFVRRSAPRTPRRSPARTA